MSLTGRTLNGYPFFLVLNSDVFKRTLFGFEELNTKKQYCNLDAPFYNGAFFFTDACLK